MANFTRISGSVVTPNPSTTATQDLNKVTIDDVTYNVVGSGGNGEKELIRYTQDELFNLDKTTFNNLANKVHKGEAIVAVTNGSLSTYFFTQVDYQNSAEPRLLGLYFNDRNYPLKCSAIGYYFDSETNKVKGDGGGSGYLSPNSIPTASTTYNGYVLGVGTNGEYKLISPQQGSQGVGIKNITSGTATVSNNQTITPITFTKTDNTTNTLNIYAQNGQKGDKGDTGAQGIKGEKGDTGAQGVKGDDGLGIKHIEKTNTNGLVDTYTITYTDNTNKTFTVTNGEKGAKGDKGDKGDTGATGAKGDKGDTGATGAKGDKGDKGNTGNGITLIEKVGENGLENYYQINYTNGDADSFTVTNGAKGETGDDGVGIEEITSNVDIQTEDYTETEIIVKKSNGVDNVLSIFAKNGVSVLGAEKTDEKQSDDGNYTISTVTFYYSDGTESTVEIVAKNGVGGSGGSGGSTVIANPSGIATKDINTISIDNVNYQIVGKKGDKGDTGAQGAKGEQGEQGIQGVQGYSVVKATSGTPTTRNEYTVTPVTFENDKPETLGYVDIFAKNGADILTATVVENGIKNENGYTETPIKFTKSDNTETNQIIIKAKIGEQGETGNGVSSIEKVLTSGLTDTYQINYTKTNPTTFTVTNGAKGEKGEQGIQGIQGEQGIQGIQGEQGVQGVQGEKGENGDDGNGITSIEKVSTSGLTDTYQINYTKSNPTNFTVTNGAKGEQGERGVGISSVSTGASSTTNGYTVTPLVFTTTNNFQQKVEVKAKNGVDGNDGVGITTIKTGEVYSSGDHTITPVTFNKTDGTSQTVNIRAQNASIVRFATNGTELKELLSTGGMSARLKRAAAYFLDGSNSLRMHECEISFKTFDSDTNLQICSGYTGWINISSANATVYTGVFGFFYNKNTFYYQDDTPNLAGIMITATGTLPDGTFDDVAETYFIKDNSINFSEYGKAMPALLFFEFTQDVN